jgi:TRAP-type C4-dicarboxylate transport system substrate-binding protein
MRLMCLVLVMVAHTAHADVDPVRLRVGTLAVEGTRYMEDMTALAAAIARRTRGAVQLDWVSDGQLGSERDMATLVQGGKLDGGAFSETGLVALVPSMAAWGKPGRFNSYDEVDKAIAGAGVERFAEAKLQFVMWADLGFARIFSRDPIGALATLLHDPALTAPFDGQLVAAIANGKARTWALPPLYTLGVANHARYMSNLRYRYIVGALVLSRDAWSRLSAEQQAAVLAVCRTWEPKLRASWRKETERAIAALDKAGVATTAATADDIRAFRELAR